MGQFLEQIRFIRTKIDGFFDDAVLDVFQFFNLDLLPLLFGVVRIDDDFLAPVRFGKQANKFEKNVLV